MKVLSLAIFTSERHKREASQWVIFGLSSSRKLYQLGTNRDQKTIEKYIIEATEFKYDLRIDLGFKKPDPARNNKLSEASGCLRSVST